MTGPGLEFSRAGFMCSVHSTPRGKPWVKSVPELPMDALHGGKLRSFASLNKGREGSLRRHFSGPGGGVGHRGVFPRLN